MFCNIETTNHRKLLLVLALIGYLFLMFGNGAVSLTHPDEVFYAQTAKEMIAHKSWLTPYLFDKPQFEKPILFYGLLVFVVKLWGMSSVVARFWPAFFAIGGLGVTYWLTWMLFHNKWTSFLSAFILSTSFIYIGLAHAVLTDMVFSILVTTSIGFFYYSYHYPKSKNIGLMLSAFFTALAALTKGLLGLCFPAITVLTYLILKKDLRFLKCRGMLWAVILFMVIALPWHILMFKLYGSTFWHEYFLNVHVRRLLEAEHEKLNTWYFYPGVVLAGTMPWSIFLIPATVFVVKCLIERNNPYREELIFLVGWIISIYLPVELAHSKLASYIFPAVPALSILIAYYLTYTMGLKNNIAQREIKMAAYILSFLILLSAIAVIIFARMYLNFITSMAPIYTFSALMLMCSVLVIIFAQQQKFQKMIGAMAGISLSLLVFVVMGKSQAEPWISCEKICSVFKTIDHSDTTVLASKFYVRAVRFYTDRNVAVIDIVGKKFFSPHPIEFLTDDETILKFLARQPITFGIVKKSTALDLERAIKSQPYQMTYLDEEGGAYIVKIEKLIPDKQVEHKNPVLYNRRTNLGISAKALPAFTDKAAGRSRS